MTRKNEREKKESTYPPGQGRRLIAAQRSGRPIALGTSLLIIIAPAGPIVAIPHVVSIPGRLKARFQALHQPGPRNGHAGEVQNGRHADGGRARPAPEGVVLIGEAGYENVRVKFALLALLAHVGVVLAATVGVGHVPAGVGGGRGATRRAMCAGKMGLSGVGVWEDCTGVNGRKEV